MDSWHTWRWDRRELHYKAINYKKIIRWRRGWITLYKLESLDDDPIIEWRLYLPFNISVGIQL